MVLTRCVSNHIIQLMGSSYIGWTKVPIMKTGLNVIGEQVGIVGFGVTVSGIRGRLEWS